MQDKTKYLTVSDVADLLSIHPNTVRTKLKDGELKGIKLGDKAGWRIEQADLNEYLDGISNNGKTQD